MDDGGGRRLGKLLRGERASVEAYEDALKDVERDGAAERILHLILERHRRALAVLEEAAEGTDEAGTNGSGPWGAFSRAVEKGASWMGDRMALKALKEGEDHGLKEYKTALAQENAVPARLRPLIESELLPHQAEHVAILDELIAGLEKPERLRTLETRIREKAGR